MSRRRRVFHPDLGGGPDVWLSDEEAHHLLRVLRLDVGDAVGVFDGIGAEVEGRIAEVDRRRVRLELGARLEGRVEPVRSVTLYQGLSRPDKVDLTVQKATEVGVAEIRLYRAARGEGNAPQAKRLDRWRRIAREACKQSGRRRIPAVTGPVDRLPAPSGEASAFLLTGEAERALVALLSPLEASRPVWLAVGPEGGFTEEERVAATAAGWQAASLGPRTLRTETAGPVALALALAASGDL